MATPASRLQPTILQLKAKGRESGSAFWRDLAERLESPRSRRAVLNIGQIARKTRPNETAVIPGKVLSAGRLDHPVTVAALGFSAKAREKVAAAGGRCLTLDELAGLESVRGVRILQG